MEQPMQQKSPQAPSNEDDEISIKDIILKTQQWWNLVWPHSIKIVALSLIIGLAAALNTKFNTKPLYTASYQLFFQEESGGLSGAMRLASSFALGGGSGSASSSATVQEFLTSRNNISHAMSEALESGRLIDRYYAEAIEGNPEFAAEFSSKFGDNQRYSDSILTQVFLALNGKITNAMFDDKTGVLRFNVTADDESFTYDLATLLVSNTEDQFKRWKRKKGQDAVDSFQRKVDSLETRIDVTLRRLGEYEDQNNSLVSSVDKMKRLRLTIDMEALKVSYGEYVKGLEMTKAEMMNIEPPFKYFDKPTFPLKKDKDSAAKSGVLGSIMTGFLLVLFIIGRSEAKKIMA
jgi:hypothetical protein